MLFNHTPTGLSHTFDDDRLIADTGLIPLVKLAQDTNLPTAVADRLHIPTDKGANPGGKVMSLIAGGCSPGPTASTTWTATAPVG